jgi:hypothetical protein
MTRVIIPVPIAGTPSRVRADRRGRIMPEVLTHILSSIPRLYPVLALLAA